MGSPSTPKAPPPPAPAPTRTSADVAQAEVSAKKRLLKKGGRASTILNEVTNPSGGGTKDKLGQ